MSDYLVWQASYALRRERYRRNNQLRLRRMAEARQRGTHTAREWEEMKAYFDCCVRCLRGDVSLERDHVIPVCLGGSDAITNIQPLCLRCNSSKGPEAKDYRPEFYCGCPEKWLPTPGGAV